MKNLYIFNLSGGIDSTLAFWRTFKDCKPSDKSDFFFCYTNLLNNFNKILVERNSITKTYNFTNNYIKKNSLGHVKLLEPSFELQFDIHGLPLPLLVASQPLLWSFALPFHINGAFNKLRSDIFNYDKIFICYGYIHGDDFWHFKNEVESLVSMGLNLLSLTRTELKMIKDKLEFLYPLEWETKKDVTKIYKNDLDLNLIREHVFTCENPDQLGVACGNCKPCRTLNEADNSFLDNSPTINVNEYTEVDIAQDIKETEKVYNDDYSI